MSFEPREYLRHILSEADYLATASAGVTREWYRQDPTLQRAFVRSLEIIGEATKKNLSPSTSATGLNTAMSSRLVSSSMSSPSCLMFFAAVSVD